MRSPYRTAASRNDARRQAGLTMVELLVTMSIAVVLTGMILMTWFALQSSSAEQARANEARDITGQAMSRMVREIRDASSSGISAIAYAGQDQVSVYTTFNDPGATDGGFGDLLMTTFKYVLGSDGVGRIIRYRDVNNTPDDPLNLSDDRATVVADHVLHDNNAPIFAYWYFGADGPATSTFPGPPVDVPADRMQYIYAVEIDLVVDMNGVHAPPPVVLKSLAQIRNARPL